MKIANVVSVQSRGNLDTSSKHGRGRSRVDRMSAFLSRYPEIEDPERLELLAFLTGGPQEEIVEVTQLRGLELRYEEFRKAHPREFSSGLGGWLPLLLIIAVVVVSVIWRMST